MQHRTGFSLCAALVASAFAALLLFAASNASAAEPRVITDATNRKVEVKDTSRTVTIGGAVTEIVYALGYGDRVIGVDLTSTFPRAALSKPSVGYMRALSAEGVISLAPSLVIAIEGSGPTDVIQILSHASAPFVLVPEGFDENAVLRKVRFIAEVLGENAKGEVMVKAITEDFAAMRAQRERVAKPRSAVFILAIGSGTPTVGGAKTSADGIFKLGGVENAMKDVTGYKPAVAESMLKAAPEAVVTMIERDHGLGPDAMFALPAFAGTPAARDRRLVPIPSYYLSFGPRTAHGAHKLAAAIYPGLTLPELPVRPWTGTGAAPKQ